MAAPVSDLTLSMIVSDFNFFSANTEQNSMKLVRKQYSPSSTEIVFWANHYQHMFHSKKKVLMCTIVGLLLELNPNNGKHPL